MKIEMYKEEKIQEKILVLGTLVDCVGNYILYEADEDGHRKTDILRINPKTKNVELFARVFGCELNTEAPESHVRVTKLK